MKSKPSRALVNRPAVEELPPHVNNSVELILLVWVPFRKFLSEILEGNNIR